MLRLFFSLYLILGLAIAAFVLSLIFLPERQILNLIARHAEYEAEGPQFLLKKEFAGIPVDLWPQHFEELRQHHGYSLELVQIKDLNLSDRALTRLRDERPVVVINDDDNNSSEWLFPLGERNLVIRAGVEQTLEEDAQRVMGIIFHLLTKQLKENPQHEWPSLVEEFDVHPSFPIRLLDLGTVDLEEAELKKLEQGTILGFDLTGNSERYFKRIENTSKVLKVGPLSDSFILQIFDYIVVAILAILVALAAFLWLRSLWRDMTMLDRSTVALGQGKLDTRLEVSRRSPVKKLATTFNFMAERIQQLIGSHKELTNAVSHELRTPIARMRFAIDMLEDTGDDADRKRYLQNVRADIDELDSLVNELLGYARLDREKPEINLTDVSLSPWLDEIVDQTSLEAPEIDFAQEAKLGGDDLNATFEPRLMSRAVSNVLRNAARYADSAVRVTYGADQAQMQITIDDDGPGIPAVDRERIFEPFTRLDTSRTRASGGHGLGLAIVNRIMEWHQGHVHVDDSPMGGARFCLCWPKSIGNLKG